MGQQKEINRQQISFQQQLFCHNRFYISTHKKDDMSSDILMSKCCDFASRQSKTYYKRGVFYC